MVMTSKLSAYEFSHQFWDYFHCAEPPRPCETGVFRGHICCAQKLFHLALAVTGCRTSDQLLIKISESSQLPGSLP